MKIEKYAAIDIGSNAVRVLVTNVVKHEKKTVFLKNALVRVPIRLGQDAFTNGEISDMNIKRMVKSMKAFKLLMKVHDVKDYLAYATSALREAKNGVKVVEKVLEKSGIKIEIIDNMSFRINDLLQGIFRGVGIKLVDFKIEYGRVWNENKEIKEIILADEISPDTCRLWDMETEKKLDKDRFRKNLGNLIEAYQDVARRLGIMPEETNISEVNFGKTATIKFKKK